MLSALRELLMERGAVSVGAVPLPALRPVMTEENIFDTARFKSVIAAIFPYYAGKMPGNLSVYCRGLDYHLVVGKRLRDAAAIFSELCGGVEFQCLVDSSVLPEVVAARMSGAAMTGLHGLSIAPPFGSYVFIGCILLDIPVDGDFEDAGVCCECGACVRACPTGAISEEGPLFFRRARCLSYLTQQRRISSEQAELLRHSPLVFGCDICQEACPYNKSAAITKINEFLDLLVSLDRREISGLSERAFRSKYKNRAFSFRGLSPILRNFEYYGV